MNHGGMDHAGHGGMDHGGQGGMDHDSPMCNMNMVWNWDTTNLCILTSSWRIIDTFSLYFSLLLIALSAVLYEYLRLYIRHLDARLARSLASPLISTHRRRASLLPTSSPAESSEIGGRRSASMSKPRRVSNSPARGRVRGWVRPLETSRRIQVWRSTLYATSTAIGFGLMLISMTFNGWVIGAIVTGAGLGHYWFNRDLSSTGALLGAAEDKGLACHM